MLCQDDPLQTGFMENGRTAENVFILYTALNITRAQKDPLYCCFNNSVMKVLRKFTEFRKFENNNLCIILFQKYTCIIKLL